MIFPKDCINDKVMSHLDTFDIFSKRVLSNNYDYTQRYIKFEIFSENIQLSIYLIIFGIERATSNNIKIHRRVTLIQIKE